MRPRNQTLAGPACRALARRGLKGIRLNHSGLYEDLRESRTSPGSGETRP
jgi:hypothetical protein